MSESLTLRPYQQAAIDQIRAHYRNGTKKVLLHLATGGGKTLIFCTVLKAANAVGTHSIMVVKGKDLVDQGSQRLIRESVPHGVHQGKHWLYRPSEQIQVCSIDTLKRRNLAPKADLIVIDEAHFATSDSFKWLFEQYPDAFYLAVTATPHVKSGLRHIADEVVYPITIKELIDQGYLNPPRYFMPTRPDLTSITIDSKTGDYKTNELDEIMDDSALLGDMVKSYTEHAYGLPALAFAVSVEHSKHIVETFNAAGISAAHVDAKSSPEMRKDLIEQLEKGDLKILSNVGILTTGVDIPCVQAIIMARPTKSYNLYIQIIGRGTRLYSGKKSFVVLDHAGNIAEHGLIEMEKECDLDGSKRDVKPQIVTCKKCYSVWDLVERWIDKNPRLAAEGMSGKYYICHALIYDQNGGAHECLTDNEPEQVLREKSERNTAANTDFEMKEITSVTDYLNIAMLTYLDKRIQIARNSGYQWRWVFHKMKDKYGENEAKLWTSYIKKNLR